MKIILTCSALLMTTVTTGTNAQGEPPHAGWATEPTLHQDRLVFVSEGDLFGADLEDEKAHRLTSHEGAESRPAFSPDGRWLAFSAEYGGNPDVFVMPAEGGAPRQLTFHPDRDAVVGWTSDGSSVLFRSGRTHPHGRSELWKVPLEGGMPEPFGFGDCSMASFAADDARMAFCRWSNERDNWKNYRGGTAPEIWFGDPGNGAFENLTENDANDMFPVWMDADGEERICFLSDRDRTPNIWTMDPDGNATTQLTMFDGTGDAPANFDIRSLAGDAAPGSSRLVFEQGGEIGILDVRDGSVTRPRIHLSSDRPQRRNRHVASDETIESASLSREGKMMAFTARGEVFVIDFEFGELLRVTDESGDRNTSATFLDEETLVVITDEGGEQQLALRYFGGPPEQEILSDETNAWFFPPVSSDDGRWVVAATARGELLAFDLETGERRLITRCSHGEISDYRISPDSRWIAWAMPNANELSEITITRLDDPTTPPITIGGGMYSDTQPRWDPAGAYLWFVSDRSMNARLGSTEFRHTFTESARVYALSLEASMPPPDAALMTSMGIDLESWSMPPQPQDWGTMEEEFASEDDSMMSEPEEAEAITIDLAGLNARVHPVSDVTPGTWSQLEATWGGFYAMRTTGEVLHNDGMDESSPPSLIRFDVLGGPTVVTEDIAHYVISGDRTTLALTNDMGEWFTYDTMFDTVEPLPPTAHLLEVDTTAEWAQILDEAWRLQRDFFWNPKLNGVDWDAMRSKYAERLDLIGSRDELDDLIGRMMSELECSHAYVWQEGEPVRSADYVPFAMLGADLAPHPDGYEIARILPGRSWDEDGRSPLASSWLGIEEGDVILEIDGRPVDPDSNPWSMLDGIAGDTVRLVVMPKDDDEDVFVVNAPVVYDESRLRYNAWVDGNRETVDAASDGRFGYLHLADMDTEGLSQFGHQFPGQGDRDGLVIDIRNNGGGFVSQLILDQLAQKVTGYDQPRHGSTMTYPQHAFPGHMVVLMDQHSGSDGDIFPYMFREMELGPLLGMRTWGGVVGIRSDKGAVDGGMTTQPEYATWTLKDGWDIENYGVDPDIEIDNTPHDHVEGRDRQLERAIEELERRTREMPIETPAPPAYPE